MLVVTLTVLLAAAVAVAIAALSLAERLLRQRDQAVADLNQHAERVERWERLLDTAQDIHPEGRVIEFRPTGERSGGRGRG